MNSEKLATSRNVYQFQTSASQTNLHTNHVGLEWSPRVSVSDTGPGHAGAADPEGP